MAPWRRLARSRLQLTARRTKPTIEVAAIEVGPDRRRSGRPTALRRSA